MQRIERAAPGLLVAALGACLVLASVARADVKQVPPDLAGHVAAEPWSGAFAPDPTAVADFALSWEGEAPAGLAATLVEGSLEFVRVAEVLRIARARLRLEGPASLRGSVRAAGASQPLHQGRAELPVALIAGPDNPVVLSVAGEQGAREHRLLLVRRPSARADRAHADASCSPYRVEATLEDAGGTWAYLGCRRSLAPGPEHRVAVLDVLVFWDHGVGPVELDGAPLSPQGPGLYALRLTPRPGHLVLRQGTRSLRLSWRLPEYPHLGSLGAGIGPYWNAFESAGGRSEGFVPLITVYGGYALDETVRIVAFGAATADRRAIGDLGLYLNYESVRLLDRRVSMNVLLGAHANGWVEQGVYQVRLGAPQGVEFVLRDALLPRADLMLGGFVYPFVARKGYVNAWLRWGRPGFFGEVNAIGWREPLGDGEVNWRSLGVSVGGSLLRFL